MKRNTLILCLVITASFSAHSQTMSDSERLFIVDYLERTQYDLLQSLDSVDEKSWYQVPADGGWSIAQIVEHIVMAEQAVFNGAAEALKQSPEELMDLRANDAWLLSKINDRGRKVTSPLVPSGEMKSKETLIRRFKEVRANTLNYVQTTQDKVRAHYGTSPYGPADVYQLLMVIGGHNMRHNAQVLETLEEIQT